MVSTWQIWRDKEFLSLISKIWTGSRHLVFWSIGKLFFFLIGPDPAHHFGLGRRCQPFKQWASPLFTCNVNSGEADAEEEEDEREREEGWAVVPHGAAGGDGGGRTRLLAVAGARCFAFIFLLSLLCFFSVFFSLSFSFLFSLLCYVFFPSFLSVLPPFFGALPCIYRKNRGVRGRGGHCAAAPKTARGARSLLFHRPVVGHG